MRAMDLRNFLQLLLLGAVWGASFLFIRLGIGEWGTSWLVALRVVSGALFLLAVALLLRRSLRMPGAWKHCFTLGLLNTALPFALFAHAAHDLSASLLSIINSTAPMWGMLVGVLLTRSLPAPRELAGLAVGVGGVALLVSRDPSALHAASPWPVVAAVLAPLCYGVASQYARRFTSELPAFSISLGSMLASVLWVLPVLAIDRSPAAGSLAQVGSLAWLSALALGVICTGFAYLIYFRLIREVGAASALTVTFLIPLFGIAWGAVFLDEPISLGTLAGALCVLMGTSWVTGFHPSRLWKRGAVGSAMAPGK